MQSLYSTYVMKPSWRPGKGSFFVRTRINSLVLGILINRVHCLDQLTLTDLYSGLCSHNHSRARINFIFTDFCKRLRSFAVGFGVKFLLIKCYIPSSFIILLLSTDLRGYNQAHWVPVLHPSNRQYLRWLQESALLRWQFNLIQVRQSMERNNEILYD